jgi:hypothetical protein
LELAALSWCFLFTLCWLFRKRLSRKLRLTRSNTWTHAHDQNKQPSVADIEKGPLVIVADFPEPHTKVPEMAVLMKPHRNSSPLAAYAPPKSIIPKPISKPTSKRRMQPRNDVGEAHDAPTVPSADLYQPAPTPSGQKDRAQSKGEKRITPSLYPLVTAWPTTVARAQDVNERQNLQRHHGRCPH